MEFVKRIIDRTGRILPIVLPIGFFKSNHKILKVPVLEARVPYPNIQANLGLVRPI